MNIERQMMSTLRSGDRNKFKTKFLAEPQSSQRGKQFSGLRPAMGINTVFYGFQDYRVAGIYFWDVPAVQAPVSVET